MEGGVKRELGHLVGGLALIAAGVIFLLQNFGYIPQDLPLLWVLLFGAGGLTFLYVFAAERRHWWPLIPGTTLLGLAALIALATLFPGIGGTLGAGVFLGSISLAFFLIYVVSRMKEWWAIIPGGVVGSVALALLLEPFVGGDLVATLIVLGIGVTFGLVYLLPNQEPERMRWALIPAGIMILVGMLIFATTIKIAGVIWAVLLFAAGGFMVYRSLRG